MNRFNSKTYKSIIKKDNKDYALQFFIQTICYICIVFLPHFSYLEIYDYKLIRMDQDSNIKYWFAFRVLHNKTTAMKNRFKEEGIKTFIPMKVTKTEGDNGFTYTESPVIPSLIFVNCSNEYLKKLRKNPDNKINVYCSPGTTNPAIIPDRDMEIFMFVTTKGCEQLESLDEKFIKGDKVRIIGGTFKGAEGYITRVHGTKRFIVKINGVAVIATTYVPKCFIEKIK